MFGSIGRQSSPNREHWSTWAAPLLCVWQSLVWLELTWKNLWTFLWCAGRCRTVTAECILCMFHHESSTELLLADTKERYLCAAPISAGSCSKANGGLGGVFSAGGGCAARGELLWSLAMVEWQRQILVTHGLLLQTSKPLTAWCIVSCSLSLCLCDAAAHLVMLFVGLLFRGSGSEYWYTGFWYSVSEHHTLFIWLLVGLNSVKLLGYVFSSASSCSKIQFILVRFLFYLYTVCTMFVCCHGNPSAHLP